MAEFDWKYAVIYHIFIDRFAGYTSEEWDRPVFLGGNIRGIIDRFDYLKELGVDTIWLSPFYKTSAYHGYHITDFFEVDPRFGTQDDLEELIALVHTNEMKIIADFVPNHCSNQHPFFIEAQDNPDSKYRDWFYFKDDDYMCFLSEKKLPKFNLDHSFAREDMIKAAKYWLSKGIDGYRLDHCIGPSNDFWKEFRTEIKKEFPESVLFGEAWLKGIKKRELPTVKVRNKTRYWQKSTPTDSLYLEYVGLLDGCLDFYFQEEMVKHVAKKMNRKQLDRDLNGHYYRFPENFLLPTFLDNHDMDRFMAQCHGDKTKLKRAVKIQSKIPQPMIIYYGTEVGMSQDMLFSEFDGISDLLARKPMIWEEQDKELLEFYKQIIRDRKNKEKIELDNLPVP